MRLCAYPSIAPPALSSGKAGIHHIMELRTGEVTSGSAHSCHDLVSLPNCYEDLASRCYC